RRAQFRTDFVAAENSMGFHAPQEAARILAEAIDYARQGQLTLPRPEKKPAALDASLPPAPAPALAPAPSASADGKPALAGN
ncbi:MAG: ammonia-forming cytochrome c nitrite reductase subunit c552, partial [Phycisphaerales bacterium]|nr:ammonia-forming cytochrome c nitrite reductase subunit c552 [Phycisphaerales bacterium]